MKVPEQNVLKRVDVDDSLEPPYYTFHYNVYRCYCIKLQIFSLYVVNGFSYSSSINSKEYLTEHKLLNNIKQIFNLSSPDNIRVVVLYIVIWGILANVNCFKV